MGNSGQTYNEDQITLQDIYSRMTDKKILATTAMYGPWLPNGEFDWQSYEHLVREVIKSGSVPATNVDTTWAIYNDWELTKQMIWRTAEIASELKDYIEKERPLVVAGLNTNSLDISADEIASSIRQQVDEITIGLKKRGLDRIRYMPVPDKRIYDAPNKKKVEVYQEIGKVIGDYTDYGLVFFELDIGIVGFGSNFSPEEVVSILAETPQIQEYKSAIINKKPDKPYPYDCCADMVRIKIVENVAPERVQFSTGNDWFINLARLGRNIKNYGYLLGASQVSPRLFQRWRNAVEKGKLEANAIEYDLQSAAKDFWTPGNVGIYRHYLAIFLAMTGLIAYPLSHPMCDARYRVKPDDYFIPLRHAIRMDLIDSSEIDSIVRRMIPGCENLSDNEIAQRIEWIG